MCAFAPPPACVFSVYVNMCEYVYFFDAYDNKLQSVTATCKFSYSCLLVIMCLRFFGNSNANAKYFFVGHISFINPNFLTDFRTFSYRLHSRIYNSKYFMRFSDIRYVAYNFFAGREINWTLLCVLLFAFSKLVI